MRVNPVFRPLYPLIGSAASGAGVITILATPARKFPLSTGTCADTDTHRTHIAQMAMRDVEVMRFLLKAVSKLPLVRRGISTQRRGGAETRREYATRASISLAATRPTPRNRDHLNIKTAHISGSCV